MVCYKSETEMQFDLWLFSKAKENLWSLIKLACIHFLCLDHFLLKGSFKGKGDLHLTVNMQTEKQTDAKTVKFFA